MPDHRTPDCFRYPHGKSVDRRTARNGYSALHQYDKPLPGNTIHFRTFPYYLTYQVVGRSLVNSRISYTLTHGLPWLPHATLYGYPCFVYKLWRPALPPGFEPRTADSESAVLPVTPWKNKARVDYWPTLLPYQGIWSSDLDQRAVCENRTRVTCLEDRRFTPKLIPHWARIDGPGISRRI